MRKQGMGWILLVLLSVTQGGFAQKYDYNWVIGTPSYEGDTTDFFGGILFSFHDSLSISSRDRAKSNLEFRYKSVAMSSAEGELLFYTNGCAVHGAHGQVLIDGDTMHDNRLVNELYCYRETGNSVSPPEPFGILVIPHPEYASRYYIVFLVEDDEITDRYSTSLHLWEIGIDNMEPTASRVLTKTVLADSIYQDPTTFSMVKSSVSGHWWLMMKDGGRWTSRSFLTLHFYTQDSFSIKTQEIGPWGEVGGRGLFSPDGAHYATVSYDDRIVLYDFDRTTGELRDPAVLSFPDNLISPKTAAFSSSGELLYVWDVHHMYQLDLLQLDVPDPLVLIDTFDGFIDPFPTGFGPAQLGPDCRLYIPSSSGSFYYHVIDYPDRRGKACGFRQRAIRLPHVNNGGLMHYPNYRLDEEPTCDSTLRMTVSVVPTEQLSTATYTLYPLPAYDDVQIELASDRHLPERIVIFDSQGRVVERQDWPGWQTSHSIDVHDYPQGLYYVQLIDTDRDGFGQQTMKMVVGR